MAVSNRVRYPIELAVGEIYGHFVCRPVVSKNALCPERLYLTVTAPYEQRGQKRPQQCVQDGTLLASV